MGWDGGGNEVVSRTGGSKVDGDGTEWNGIRACLGSIAMIAEPLLVSLFVSFGRGRGEGGRGENLSRFGIWFYSILL